MKTTIGGMNTTQNPHDAVKAVLDNPVLPAGDDERFVGFGVMGLPFESGHYLALRQFPDGIVRTGVSCRCGTAIRPARGRSTPPRPAEQSCARYFSSATGNDAVQCDIDVDVDHAVVVLGDDPRTARSGRSTCESTFATRLMTKVGEQAPGVGVDEPEHARRHQPRRRCDAGRR